MMDYVHAVSVIVGQGYHRNDGRCMNSHAESVTLSCICHHVQWGSSDESQINQRVHLSLGIFNQSRGWTDSDKLDKGLGGIVAWNVKWVGLLPWVSGI